MNGYMFYLEGFSNPFELTLIKYNTTIRNNLSFILDELNFDDYVNSNFAKGVLYLSKKDDNEYYGSTYMYCGGLTGFGVSDREIFIIKKENIEILLKGINVIDYLKNYHEKKRVEGLIEKKKIKYFKENFKPIIISKKWDDFITVEVHADVNCNLRVILFIKNEKVNYSKITPQFLSKYISEKKYTRNEIKNIQKLIEEVKKEARCEYKRTEKIIFTDIESKLIL